MLQVYSTVQCVGLSFIVEQLFISLAMNYFHFYYYLVLLLSGHLNFVRHLAHVGSHSSHFHPPASIRRKE